MQQFLSALMLSASSNLDTLTVAISYGMYKIKIPFISNLLIAIITTVGTFLSMEFGSLLENLIPSYLTDMIGGLILVLIGAWFLKDALRDIMKNKKQSNNSEDVLLNDNLWADKDNSGDISIKETFSLALALTINNLGVGIAASITGVSIFYSTLFTFIITILSVSCGTWIGKSMFGKLFGKYASIISSILLIILGTYESFI
ncbi:sporulation membrane protein YtaF [uncultured Clostridium sp.]|uniref:sporulation membrane protein YtaF n=1 Tax=uncultured Clostridium sp. TaxID=59620 RepID=UPI0028E8145D|nr:sporulation membrane protein YtaF [uncultured Clostridium sp.]